MKAFEDWLSANTGWWGKVPMTNIRTIDGRKIVLEGYVYSLEDPVEYSELARNPQHAIQNQALKLLGVSDLNMIWTEIGRQELAP